MKQKKSVRSKGRKPKVSPEPVVRPPKLQVKQKISAPEDLEAFIREANEVRGMTVTPGWAIIERDLLMLRNNITDKLAYTNPKRLEFYEAQLLYIGIDKVIALVNDYEVNRDKAMEMLNKIQNPDLAITMDMDNE